MSQRNEKTLAILRALNDYGPQISSDLFDLVSSETGQDEAQFSAMLSNLKTVRGLIDCDARGEPYHLTNMGESMLTIAGYDIRREGEHPDAGDPIRGDQWEDPQPAGRPLEFNRIEMHDQRTRPEIRGTFGLEDLDQLAPLREIHVMDQIDRMLSRLSTGEQRRILFFIADKYGS